VIKRRSGWTFTPILPVNCYRNCIVDQSRLISWTRKPPVAIICELSVPWTCPLFRRRISARTLHASLFQSVNHFQSFLMSKDHLNCRWVCWSSSTNLDTAS
jgi:hypothetical protein